MDYNDAKLVIHKSNNESATIHLPISKKFKYRMDNTALMVCQDDEPVLGNVAGFYIFKYGNYYNVNRNSTVVGDNANCYDFTEQTLYDYDFKTYLIKYEDQTVNRVFVYKIKDDIIGQVEIQKIGAKGWDEYEESDVEPFLYFLVNVQVERNDIEEDIPIEEEKPKKEKKVKVRKKKSMSTDDPDTIIKSLNNLAPKVKIAIGIALGILVIGMIAYIITKTKIILPITLALVGVFLFIAFWSFFTFRRYLSTFDLKEVKNDLKYSCKAFDEKKTYFTNLYLITCYYTPFICRYEDIAWIYPRDKYSKGEKVGTNIVIKLYNKKHFVIPYDSKFLELIETHTSDILMGYNENSRKTYKDLTHN